MAVDSDFKDAVILKQAKRLAELEARVKELENIDRIAMSMWLSDESQTRAIEEIKWILVKEL